MEKKDTICWRCDKACGKCSWSKSFVPVENWIAKPTKVKIEMGKYLQSYIVYECPEFRNDGCKNWQVVKAKDVISLLGFYPKQLYRTRYKDLKQIALDKGFELDFKFSNDQGVTYLVNFENIGERDGTRTS